MSTRDISLLAVSAAVGLLLVELLLRGVVSPSSLYGSFRTQPALNQWKNEVRFYERYSDVSSLLSTHDPGLGWDFDIANDRIRGNRRVALAPPTDSLRIVAVGDSYTYGTDVAANENFAALLDAEARYEVLNMAVPGYGIDQAYLKYIEHGAGYQPHVVLFGIYVGDYERTAVGFSAAAKPWLELSAGALAVRGRPVPGPVEELDRIRAELAGRVYVYELLLNGWRRLRSLTHDDDSYFESTDRVIAALLRDLRERMRDDQRLLVVHVPRAEAFVAEDTLRDEMSRRLLAIYDELNLTHINLLESFVQDMSAEDVYEQLYVHERSGSVGHLSASGHQRVAELVKAALESQSSDLAPPQMDGP